LRRLRWLFWARAVKLLGVQRRNGNSLAETPCSAIELFGRGLRVDDRDLVIGARRALIDDARMTLAREEESLAVRRRREKLAQWHESPETHTLQLTECSSFSPQAGRHL